MDLFKLDGDVVKLKIAALENSIALILSSNSSTDIKSLLSLNFSW